MYCSCACGCGSLSTRVNCHPSEDRRRQRGSNLRGGAAQAAKARSQAARLRRFARRQGEPQPSPSSALVRPLLGPRKKREGEGPAWLSEASSGPCGSQRNRARLTGMDSKRHLWDSNPRGETPSAEQADALAARPKCLLLQGKPNDISTLAAIPTPQGRVSCVSESYALRQSMHVDFRAFM